jgi:hypothetical protein
MALFKDNKVEITVEKARAPMGLENVTILQLFKNATCSSGMAGSLWKQIEY